MNKYWLIKDNEYGDIVVQLSSDIVQWRYKYISRETEGAHCIISLVDKEGATSVPDKPHNVFKDAENVVFCPYETVDSGETSVLARLTQRQHVQSWKVQPFNTHTKILYPECIMKRKTGRDSFTVSVTLATDDKQSILLGIKTTETTGTYDNCLNDMKYTEIMNSNFNDTKKVQYVANYLFGTDMQVRVTELDEDRYKNYTLADKNMYRAVPQERVPFYDHCIKDVNMSFLEYFGYEYEEYNLGRDKTGWGLDVKGIHRGSELFITSMKRLVTVYKHYIPLSDQPVLLNTFIHLESYMLENCNEPHANTRFIRALGDVFKKAGAAQDAVSKNLLCHIYACIKNLKRFCTEAAAVKKRNAPNAKTKKLGNHISNINEDSMSYHETMLIAYQIIRPHNFYDAITPASSRADKDIEISF